jgi:hypothetical protein
VADIVLASLIIGPMLLTYFLRSNGALVYLSVCAGYVAAALASNELATTLSSSNFKLRNTDIALLLMFIPMALTIFLTSRAVSGQAKIIMHTVAAGLAGALFILSGTAFLNISLHLNLSETQTWPLLSSGQSLIAGLGSIYCLVIIWFFSKRSDKKHKK